MQMLGLVNLAEGKDRFQFLRLATSDRRVCMQQNNQGPIYLECDAGEDGDSEGINAPSHIASPNADVRSLIQAVPSYDTIGSTGVHQ